MSYYMDMGFVKVESKLDAYEKMKKFCDLCFENYKSVLDEEKYYIPSIRLGEKHENANMYWLYTAFTYNFIYWEQYNLLGVKGCHFPEAAKKMFSVYIPFQNSTDQDYEFEIWGTEIDIFNEVVDKFKNASEDVVKETTIKRYNYWDEEWDFDIDYCRRSCVYEIICDTIDFHRLLDGKDGDFERISMCAINTQEELMTASQYCRYLVYMDKQEMEAL